MSTLLQRLKHALSPSWRTRLRRTLGLGRWQLCPWRVGFVVGGTMKGGTTALSAFLSAHPELQMPHRKEAHFFDDDSHFPPDDPPDYAAYLRHFAPTAATRLLGDATPLYVYRPGCAARIASYNPAMKWVLLLRQPAERAFSHWNMYRRQGLESFAFDEALAAEAGRLRADDRSRRVYSYADRGFYARQLRRLFALVPRSRVLVLRTEELRDDHHATLRRVFSFLGVDPGVRVEPATVHAHPYEAALEPGLRRALTARFADDLRDLERLLGWDLGGWLSA